MSAAIKEVGFRYQDTNGIQQEPPVFKVGLSTNIKENVESVKAYLKWMNDILGMDKVADFQTEKSW